MQQPRFHTLRSAILTKLRHSFPRAYQPDLEDALSSAFEAYLTQAPVHVRECERRSKAWLFTAAWRMVRREQLRGSRYMELEEAIPSPKQIALPVEHLTLELGDRSREIVHMHSLEGLRPREIAAMLGCSVNAVNMHLKRAYRALRTSLKRDYAVLQESYHYWLSTFKLSYAVEYAVMNPPPL